MKLFLLVLFLAFSVLLLASCFCRATHTHKGNTRRPVRWTFTAQGVLACICCFAPCYGYEPDGLATGLVGVLALTQVVTSHYWRQGVPRQFRKEPS